MTIELPDVKLGSQPLTSEQARIELAAGLYANRQVTLGQAAKIAGIPYVQFMKELGQRHICMNYGIEDLDQDIATVRRRLAQ